MDNCKPIGSLIQEAPISARIWNAEQLPVIHAFWYGKPGQHVLNRSRAGSGKTSVIVEGLKKAPEIDVLASCFNTRIAGELQKRITKPGVQVSTLHSQGMKIIRQFWGNQLNLQQDRCMIKVNQIEPSAPFAISVLASNLAGQAKLCTPLAQGWQELSPLITQFKLEPEREYIDQGWTEEIIARIAFAVLRMCREKDGTFDYADMLWLPLINNWAAGRYDLVVIDEAQDMNPAQILLARRLCRDNGRIIVVGDDRQCIYEFMGASTETLDQLKTELHATEYVMPVSHRCSKAVAREAQKFVRDFRAAPDAPEGSVTICATADLVAHVTPGCFVLCRKNGPLADVCIRLLKKGIRARIEGKDIGKGILALVRKLNAASVPDLLAKLAAWERKEIKRAKATEKQVEDKIADIKDRAEVLEHLIEGLASVNEVKNRIESLFSDAQDTKDTTAVVCSSVHKAKGLECERAILLSDYFKHTSMEEENIQYVAITRAKLDLVYAWENPLDAQERAREKVEIDHELARGLALEDSAAEIAFEAAKEKTGREQLDYENYYDQDDKF